MGIVLRAYVYVDALNFYYGAVKHTRLKWLDFGALFSRILSTQYDIQAIKYFTAYVSGHANDPRAPDRQKIYIKALKAHRPEIQVILGKFAVRKVRLPLVTPIGSQRFVEVWRPEEKGSDVNLAVHLVNDGWLDLFDAAVVVSNDRDLSEALRIVKSDLNKEVILLTPYNFRNQRAKELKLNSTYFRTIKPADLEASQLPDPIPGTRFHKPPSW